VAIGTYAELLTAAANWLDRDDLTDRIPEFIALAEADINAQMDLRTVESDVTLTTTLGSRYAPLPAGYREPQNLWLQWPSSAGRETLRMVPPELMDVTTVNSIPTAWGVDGTNIAFSCPISSTTDYTLTLRMIGGVALTASATTNLILTNYPNVYLFGLMKEASPYLRDAEAAVMWEQKYSDALGKAIAKEGRGKGLTTLSTEPAGLTRQRSGFNVYRGY
jgi:hypothetical protein